MKRAWAEASRVEEVGDAAHGWADAGAIDAPTRGAIERAYPESHIELHPVWRVLIFVIATVAGGALFAGIFHDVQKSSDLRWPTFVYGVVLASATDLLRGSRLSGTGADAATSFLAIVFLLVALGIRLDESKLSFESITTAILAALAVAAALAAWRWGFWFWAGTSTAAAFLWIGRMPAARPTWLAASGLLLAWTWRRLDRASIAPPHRRGFAAVFAVAAAALYTTVNLYALDQHWVEAIYVLFRNYPTPPPVPFALRLSASLATATFPVVFLAWGIRSRRRLLLAIAIASAVLSVMTWRYYVPIGPKWTYLTAWGAVLIAAALWAHRRLRLAPGGVWRGLTAAPLYDSRRDAHLTPLGALGAHLIVPSAAPEPERPGFTGGGGEFGGGGASGTY